MIVLASQSPRRREILESAGLEFTVRIPRVQELRKAGERAREYAMRLAGDKAHAIDATPDEIVLAADTVVVIDGAILEKPRDATDAAAMLHRLSGRQHDVVTGVCLRRGKKSIVDHSVTRVRFVPLSDEEIDAYVESGEPMDKAGAYGIQGLASKFVDQIEGDYFNVVGLPIALVYKHLKELE